MRALLPVCALAACTYPEKTDLLECLGGPRPIDAEPQVTLTGNTLDPQTGMPIGGATLRLMNSALSTLDGPVTSSGTGGFGFNPLNSSGRPVPNTDIYVNGVADGRLTTYFTPPRPLVESQQLVFTMVSNGQYQIIQDEAETTFVAGTGVVLLEVRGCDGESSLPGEAGIEGVTLEASNGSVFYFEGVFPNPARTSTDNTGFVLVANVQPPSVDLTATVFGRKLPVRTVTIAPDAITQTIMMP